MHPLEQLRRAQRDGRRVPAQRRHEPRDAGRARQGRARCSRASRATRSRRTCRASTTTTRSRRSTCRCSATTAARASCRCSPTRSSASACERVDGVARVDVGGLTVREVRIDLDPQRLRAYQLTPAEVVDRAAARQRRPAGGPAHRPEGGRDRCASKARCATPKAVRRRRRRHAATAWSLRARPTSARWSSASASPTRSSRINGQPAISFKVFKQQDANIVATGEAIKAAMDELRKTPAARRRAAPGLRRQRLGQALARRACKHTLIEGALLTVAIVFLFLHCWRSTVITGLTLPIAVISAFIAVYAFGFTLNFMTMMALSLCIGLLIDDAIVVRENIVRHVAHGQGPPHRGARGHRRDRPGGDGDHLRDLRGVRAGRVHGRHRRQVLLSRSASR